jgi:putative ABC transport system substrate-binding protein
LLACIPFRHSKARFIGLGCWTTALPKPVVCVFGRGKNIALEPRSADGQGDRLPALARELVDLHVDVIVTAGNRPAIAAQHATASVPIVMATGSEQLAIGVIAGLARPGGNVTGVTTLSLELNPKRLEFLREIIPTGSRLGILWDLGWQGAELNVRQTQSAAQARGIALEDVGVQRPDELDNALSAMVQRGVVAVIVQSSVMFFTNRIRLAELAIKNRLATMTPERDYAQAGGLVAYGSDFSVGFRRAADFVDKILKGAKPADLPIEQPTKFELIVNLKTAKAIGLTIPEAFLLRADEVIE